MTSLRPDPEATLPPLRALGGLVCPRCRKPAPDEPPPSGDGLRRCPEHGLAYLAVHALEAAGDDPMLGVRVAGRFTILGRLGSGSMGAVYRARQDTVGRDIALKIVRRDRAYDPETRARFEREARATSALTSAHTVTAFDFGEAEDGSWFLAMELLDGETLGQRLQRAGAMPWQEAVVVVRDALRSLNEAHSKGIVHRDLKPDNLFLTRVDAAREDGREEIGMVLDFGIAKVLDEQRVDQLETQAGTVFGTPRYMSPEQAQGKPLDGRSDLYSLGVILYHALVGHPPFVDDDAVVVMAHHIKRAPPPLAEVAPDLALPAALEEVLAAVLEKNPADRPQSGEDLERLLDTLLEAGDGTGPHSTSWATPALPVGGGKARRSRLLVGVAAALAAALVLALLLWPPAEGPEAASGELATQPVAEPVSGAPATPPVAPAPPSVAATSQPASEQSAAPAASASTKPPKWPVAPKGVQRKAGDRYGRFE